MPEVEGSGDPGVRCRSPTACGRWWRRGSRELLGRLVGGLVRVARGMRAGAQRLADDPRRHQHLGTARARSRPVGRGRPGPADAVPSGRGARGGGRRGRRPAHPPPPRPLRGGAGVRGVGGVRRTRARPGLPARLRGPRRRRRGGGRRPGGPRGRDARPHRRLAVVRAAGGACGADRRHRARPRDDGGRAPRRPARRLPRLARPAARPRRGAGDRHDLARPRPGHRRRPAGPRPLPRAPPGAARAGPRRAALAPRGRS